MQSRLAGAGGRGGFSRDLGDDGGLHSNSPKRGVERRQAACAPHKVAPGESSPAGASTAPTALASGAAGAQGAGSSASSASGAGGAAGGGRAETPLPRFYIPTRPSGAVAV